MYNDIYDYRLAYSSESYNKSDYTLNLSGPAICITCGSVIGYNDVDPRSVSCFNCSGEFKCNCCVILKSQNSSIVFKTIEVTFFDFYIIAF